jgi:DNA-directed RNA polymerase specialized sigma subunit
MSSPLLERTNAQPLSMALLREHVPVVQEGHRALIRLREEEATLENKERRTLLQAKVRGQRSQETLVISALPLIKSIAKREMTRRQSGWNSKISYDDILQEAIAGFLRGLLSFKNMSDNTSPTNYLGQWITSSIRRKVEVMEHDFAIPYEVVERSRRIKAVRSRLTSELGREPNQDELLQGLNASEQYQTGYKWGRTTDESGQQVAKSGAKNFSERQLDEAKDVDAVAYQIGTYDTHASDDEEGYERVSNPLTISPDISHAHIDERDLSRSQLDFFEQAFVAMRIGSKQKDVLLRTYGLNPYLYAQSQKEVVAETGYPARFVKEVLFKFSVYMRQPGGVFHRLILDLDADLIEDLELSWLLPLIGDWPKNQRTPAGPPDILTQTGTRVK